MNELSWLYGKPHATGVLKASPQDFIVLEELGFAPDGEGEHLLVRIRKTGCNTRFVADALAHFAGIPVRAVSYAGLKDRHAVTEQWFCLHLPGKENPALETFHLAGCEVISSVRQRRKLRIGALQGNQFHLILRHISDPTDVEQRLTKIIEQGVPNYFGEQRFGRAGNNLLQACYWARGEIQVKERSKRSFYLSAARSALFNQLASLRITCQAQRTVWVGDALQLTGRGSWFIAQPEELSQLQQRVMLGELQITAALPGEKALGTEGDALLFEQQSIARQEEAELLGLLQREGVETARRAILVQPQGLTWAWQDETTLGLSFSLPAGSFATSVVRELIQSENQNVVADE